MKVGVDIDGTLSQTFEYFVQQLERRGYDVGEPDLDHYSWGHGHADFGEVPAEEFDTIYEKNMHDWRRSYEVYPGAWFVLTHLDDEIVAVTNRRVLDGEGGCPHTEHWVEQRGFPLERIHHTSDKAVTCEQHDIDVLIEDTVFNARDVAQSGVPVLLFDKKYNRGFSHDNVTRFSHWIEVPLLLERLRED